MQRNLLALTGWVSNQTRETSSFTTSTRLKGPILSQKRRLLIDINVCKYQIQRVLLITSRFLWIQLLVVSGTQCIETVDLSAPTSSFFILNNLLNNLGLFKQLCVNTCIVSVWTHVLYFLLPSTNRFVMKVNINAWIVKTYAQKCNWNYLFLKIE